jgi:hypothetical protein
LDELEEPEEEEEEEDFPADLRVRPSPSFPRLSRPARCQPSPSSLLPPPEKIREALGKWDHEDALDELDELEEPEEEEEEEEDSSRSASSSVSFFSSPVTTGAMPAFSFFSSAAATSS